jgi:hypothetical protein
LESIRLLSSQALQAFLPNFGGNQERSRQMV